MSSQLLISSHTSQQEKMCGQGELVNLASINLQLGTKKQIRKNEEVADLNYLCKTFVAALHTNKSSFVLKIGTIHMLSIYQFFPQIDQFLLYHTT